MSTVCGFFNGPSGPSSWMRHKVVQPVGLHPQCSPIAQFPLNHLKAGYLRQPVRLGDSFSLKQKKAGLMCHITTALTLLSHYNASASHVSTSLSLQDDDKKTKIIGMRFQTDLRAVVRKIEAEEKSHAATESGQSNTEPTAYAAWRHKWVLQDLLRLSHAACPCYHA